MPSATDNGNGTSTISLPCVTLSMRCQSAPPDNSIQAYMLWQPKQIPTACLTLFLANTRDDTLAHTSRDMCVWGVGVHMPGRRGLLLTLLGFKNKKITPSFQAGEANEIFCIDGSQVRVGSIHRRKYGTFPAL
jgi:hypothetical protein